MGVNNINYFKGIRRF